MKKILIIVAILMIVVVNNKSKDDLIIPDASIRFRVIANGNIWVNSKIWRCCQSFSRVTQA